MIVRKYRVGIDITRYKRMFLIGILLSITFTATIVGLFVYNIMNDRYNEMLLAHEAEVEDLKQEHFEQIELVNNQYDAEINALENVIMARDAHITILEERLNNVETIGSEDFQLLQKYWYVFKDAKADTGLTVDLLRFADEQCKKWDVNPDWMWHIYNLESNYYIDVRNPTTGVVGIGQVMPSTGKTMWENILGYGPGTFTVDMLYDPYVNIEITVALIGRNIANGSMYDAIALYSADRTGSYYDAVVNSAKSHGIVLDNSVAHYK